MYEGLYAEPSATPDYFNSFIGAKVRPPLYQRFVDKAEEAMIAAVEVYNKPSFKYREEAFSILALNSWELLAKAKLLKDADNDVRAIRIYESRTTKTGKQSKKLYLRTNGAGNPMTIGFMKCIAKLHDSPTRLPAEVSLNLRALLDIRDNSVHYLTPSAKLARMAQEVAAATVANFVILAKRWFSRDLATGLNLVLPLSFIPIPSDAMGVVVSVQEERLINHLQSLVVQPQREDSELSVAIKLNVKLEKSRLDGASSIVFSRDADAIKVHLTDEDVLKKYPWTYEDLCTHMAKRFSDFKVNGKFHSLRKKLAEDEKFAKVRYLDMNKKAGLQKTYFNPNIIPAFEEHYTRR